MGAMDGLSDTKVHAESGCHVGPYLVVEQGIRHLACVGVECGEMDEKKGRDVVRDNWSLVVSSSSKYK